MKTLEKPKASTPSQLLEQVCDLARQAGEAILGYYGSKTEVKIKDDASPVTAADLEAHRIIIEGLQLLTPELPAVSEENERHDAIPSGKSFWLIDPLDGTKSFIKHDGEFTVNIALIEHDQPVLGVVYLPTHHMLYGAVVGEGAFLERKGQERQNLSTRSAPEEGLDVVTSKSHPSIETEKYLRTLKIRHRIAAGSSLKFCVIAEGRADIYPRFGPTMEWDTAAGHAVLIAAGGKVLTPDGKALSYNKSDFRNGHFIASGT